MLQTRHHKDVQRFIREKVHSMCLILNCLTHFFANIGERKIKFCSVNYYSSFDFKPKCHHCIAKTMK